MLSVNDGQTWEARYIANVDAYITHYGTHGFRGRFIDEGRESKVILYCSGIFQDFPLTCLHHLQGKLWDYYPSIGKVLKLLPNRSKRLLKVHLGKLQL